MMHWEKEREIWCTVRTVWDKEGETHEGWWCGVMWSPVSGPFCESPPPARPGAGARLWPGHETGPPRQRLLRKQKQHIPKLTRLFPLPASRGAPNKKESTRKTRMSTNQHDGAQTWDLSDCGPHGAAPPQGPAQTATLSEVFLWAPRRSSVTRTKPKPLL